MYKIGMYGDSFNPLHIGHINSIIMVTNQCRKLYVVLSVTKDMDNVCVFEIFDNNSKDTYDWDQGVKNIKNYIRNKIDVVFAGSDNKVNDGFNGKVLYK